jgi:CBS domain-containing protein
VQIKTLARALRGAISTLESTMKRNEPVRKIMTSNPVTVQLGQSVAEAYKMLLEYDFHHVPVLDGKKLVGLITSTDIGRITYSFDTDNRMSTTLLDHTRYISDIMQQNLTSVASDASIREAAEILGQGEFHALPVVDDGDLVGIVTSTDLIRYLLEQY